MFYAHLPSVGRPFIGIRGDDLSGHAGRLFQGGQDLAMNSVSETFSSARRHPIWPLMLFSAGQRRIMTDGLTLLYEESTGTLLVQRSDLKPGEADAELDDNEMVVVTDSLTGQVVSVTIPFVGTYWRHNFRELVDNIRRYLPVRDTELRRIIPS